MLLGKNAKGTYHHTDKIHLLEARNQLWLKTGEKQKVQIFLSEEEVLEMFFFSFCGGTKRGDVAGIP